MGCSSGSGQHKESDRELRSLVVRASRSPDDKKESETFAQPQVTEWAWVEGGLCRTGCGRR